MADLDAAARILLDAYSTRRPVPPLADGFGTLTIDDAYAIQQIQIRTRIGAGAGIAGFKVGLTSEPMRQQFGVNEPDFGHLLTDMAYLADASVPVSNFLQPRAEPEIALVLGRPLRGPRVTVTDVAAATSAVVPAIEIIDSRIAEWKISLLDTVADNASSGGFVVGQSPVPLANIDLSLTGCVLRRNGRIAATGAGAAVLGSPLHAAAWLANELLSRGAQLEPGHVILTGSVTAAIPVAAGDAVTASFDRLGSVTAVFD
ncbi:MAG TPA: 2-keto-4-pentenoate hydratase [Streptosporangiaceae bacterium]|nr:2-keto-4-pentenoate hydratase [Streptosporangiaceae bacterium]